MKISLHDKTGIIIKSSINYTLIYKKIIYVHTVNVYIINFTSPANQC